jgi:hypothetical protein
LTRDIPVVPVLLDGAELPDEAELPDDIKGLLNRNAEFVDFRTFDADVQRLIKKLGVGTGAKQTAAPATVGGTVREQVVERNARDTAEDSKTQDDLLDKVRENRPFDKEWRKRWLTPVVAATVLLAVGVIGTLVSWSPGLLSGGKVEVTQKDIDGARQAAEAKTADTEKARQAAEAKAADAEKARQAAEARAADAEARQAAEAKAVDTGKAGQAAGTAAPQAVANLKFTIQSEILAMGAFIESNNSESADECRQKCENNSGCRAFAFQGYHPYVPRCSLYSTITDKSYGPGYTSGWR